MLSLNGIGAPEPKWHYRPLTASLRFRRLLRETRMSVIGVALEVGYTDPSHFARLFRREPASR